MIKVLYEDDWLIFIDKPAGMVVQRGYDAEEPVLLEMVNEYLGQPAFLMQRLDRGTSGVIFFTRQSGVNRNLTRQFERKTIRKAYIALCQGELGQRQLIDAPLARVGPISFGIRAEGKRSLTQVAPISSNRGASLVRLDLLTGRTHQIRVHLAAIGHPLVGDWLYGERNAARPMLHAERLIMSHPVRGNILEVASPIPPDFSQEATRRGVTIDEDVSTSSEAIRFVG